MVCYKCDLSLCLQPIPTQAEDVSDHYPVEVELNSQCNDKINVMSFLNQLHIVKTGKIWLCINICFHLAV